MQGKGRIKGRNKNQVVQNSHFFIVRRGSVCESSKVKFAICLIIIFICGMLARHQWDLVIRQNPKCPASCRSILGIWFSTMFASYCAWFNAREEDSDDKKDGQV